MEFFSVSADAIHLRNLKERIIELSCASCIRTRTNGEKNTEPVRGGEPKPYTGLLRCSSCGSSITAEVQKGHTYYRCTKKNKAVKCCQPYVREEVLDCQISGLLAPYGLRGEWATQMLSRLEGERKLTAQATAQQVAEKRTAIAGFDQKIQRLLDMRLEGEIDRDAYLSRKEALMGQRKLFEQDIATLTQGQNPWLEPFKSWILEAQSLEKIAQEGSLSQKRVLAKKVFGSNLVLDCRKASGRATKPWAFIADNVLPSQVVRVPGVEPGSMASEATTLSIVLHSQGTGRTAFAAAAEVQAGFVDAWSKPF